MRRRVFDDDHELFRESVKQFVERTMLPLDEQIRTERTMPREVWLEAGRQGFLGMQVPEEYGGADAGGAAPAGTARLRDQQPGARQGGTRGDHRVRQGAQGVRRLRPALRRIRLHEGVPGRPRLDGRPGHPHLGRLQRDHERDHRTVGWTIGTDLVWGAVLIRLQPDG
jgi:Acyl-CoA dehydrogenase, N-terminal domain